MTEFQQFKVESPAGVNFAREPSQLNPMLWDEAGNIAFKGLFWLQKVNGWRNFTAKNSRGMFFNFIDC